MRNIPVSYTHLIITRTSRPERKSYTPNSPKHKTANRHSDGIDYERVGNIVFPTPFSKLKLINSDIEKLKHNIIINNIAVDVYKRQQAHRQMMRVVYASMWILL